jgi:hypothetical protein
MENCSTESYGTISFNSIERKESLVYIWIFRVFRYFLLNFLTHLVEIATRRISVIALMDVLILSELD